MVWWLEQKHSSQTFLNMNQLNLFTVVEDDNAKNAYAIQLDAYIAITIKFQQNLICS